MSLNMSLDFRQIQSQWQSNLRLRIMLYIIVISLMMYMLLFFVDSAVDSRAQLNRQVELLNKISVIQNEPQWFDREKEVASHRIKFQNQLWQASSKGLAQAKVQAFLNQLLKDLKIANSKVTLETVETILPENGAPPLWRVSAQLQGNFTVNTLQKLLWSISTKQNLLTIRSLNFTLHQTRRGANHFTLYTDAWFVAPSDSREGDSDAQ